MSPSRAPLDQQSESRAPWTLIYGLPLLAVAVVVGLARGNGVDPTNLFRDPVATLHGKFYTGVFSNLGVALWAFAASSSFMAWRVLSFSKAETGARSFLAASAALNLYLMLDDLFLFHEDVFPDYLHIGETVVLLLDAVLMLAYLIRYQKVLRSFEPALLMSAGILLAGSLGADFISDHFRYFHGNAAILDDVLKWLGLAGWCVYHVRYSLQAIRNNFS